MSALARTLHARTGTHARFRSRCTRSRCTLWHARTLPLPLHARAALLHALTRTHARAALLHAPALHAARLHAPHALPHALPHSCTRSRCTLHARARGANFFLTRTRTRAHALHAHAARARSRAARAHAPARARSRTRTLPHALTRCTRSRCTLVRRRNVSPASILPLGLTVGRRGCNLYLSAQPG